MAKTGRTFIVGSAKKGSGSSAVARNTATQATKRIQSHKSAIAQRSPKK